MGVITTADENLEKARENIRLAIQYLSSVLVEECWGHDEYSDEFLETLEGSFDQLRRIRKKLK